MALISRPDVALPTLMASSTRLDRVISTGFPAPAKSPICCTIRSTRSLFT